MKDVKQTYRQRLVAGELLLGGQLRFGTPAIAELYGHAGYDFLVIDGEHAPQTPVGVQAQLQAAGCTDTTPLVRLGRTDPDEIRLYLDMGANGIVVPLIRTAAEARVGADACRYPPEGTRSYGPARGAAYGFDPDHYPGFDDQVVFVPIIETSEALDNLDEILAVDGLDSFIVGLCDLSFALGVPMDLEHSGMQDAVGAIAKAAQRAGKPAGMGVPGDPSDPATFGPYVDMGYTLFLASGDEWMLHAACRAGVSAFARVRG